jgi:hypothetical protein
LKKADDAKISKKKENKKPVKKEKPTELELLYQEVEEFNDLSNSVVDLIHAKQFDEAEKVCHRLSQDYPEQVDGIERLAMVYEARGDKKQAAHYYRKTVEFMQSHDGFDPENIEWHLEQAEKLEKELKN